MSPWWSKSSSKEAKKKANGGGGIFGTIQRKLKSPSESKQNSSRRHIESASEIGSHSRVGSRSCSPSTHVARSISFAERPHAHPLPLPNTGRADSGKRAPRKVGIAKGSSPLLLFPLPKPNHVQNAHGHADVEGDVATDSVFSDSDTDSDDPSDSRLISPHASDFETGNKTSTNSPSSRVTYLTQKTRDKSKPAKACVNNQTVPTSPKRRPVRQMAKLQIPQPNGALYSAPDSSMSSPSRSPMRFYEPEPSLTSGFWAARPYADAGFLGSGQCSSPGSGHNSSHNSVGGDMAGQLFWQHNRCSPECSPIPSPRMTSPGPSSRIQSGSVTPLHPRANGSTHDGSAHRLPLPPLTISNVGPYSPSYSTGTTPTVPRSPGRVEVSASHGSRWKKGRLLGRGTFGHVYLGFNSGSGEMCAMKEVTLFADDAKSKESAQQLGQEIALLSRLRHPNIVQYYGSETVDDKLYIYLEYVSGGSIHKLLQDYGPLGEIAIRSYTHQILSGLVYLHAKNTVHRDIKGANILVDPNGRVKLADFGMAKHISGPACPLSFKGSPYWMAPEVINNNSDGCNLAVDIWSLGCTVLEMATTKPPWSQYEGVAALFKVGNSKELPVLPDHLSEDGKDFILQCLQREPCRRPSAAQLLDHPFVRNIASSERLIPNPGLITNSMRSLGIGNGSDPISGFQSRSYVPHNISCPVSNLGSPLLHSRSGQNTTGRRSPSAVSSPRTISGSSTPLTGAGGGGAALPFYQQVPKTYAHEFTGLTLTSRSPTRSFGPHSSGPYFQDPRPDMFRAMPQGSPFFQEIVPSDNDFLGNQKEKYGGQSVLADRVSQQLLRDPVKQYPTIDLKPTGPVVSRRGRS
ncbi:mitogen-activated protein kinase kinase kinase YODA-like [Rutidosis leptorrhynchoides]|uniref:mitogen-activated protein kinase kinase kinase YODA-like n=1 Tax=Rutidosis leptorrhynchoides TaxID=125765 RepID=UPI003A9956A6